MKLEELYLTDEELGAQILIECRKTTAPKSAWHGIAKYAADNAVKKIVEHLEDSWLYHCCDQISGEVLLMEDVAALRELIE